MTDFIGPVVKLPLVVHDFPGFYYSSLSDALDHEEEQAIEYDARDRQDDQGIPAELRLSEEQFGDIYRDAADYRGMYEEMAENFTSALDQWCTERFGFPTNIHFHSLWSPREYNFSTDVLTVWVPESTMRTLMIHSLADSHTMLAAVLKDELSPRSGFIPSYSNELTEWLNKPLLEWDQVELGLLLHAVAMIGRGRGDRSMIAEVTDLLLDCDCLYQTFSNHVDWERYDLLVKERRDELEDEHRAAVDPDYVPPARRCPETPDLFRQAA